MTNYVECIRKGPHRPFRLKREVCIAIQSNLDRRCPKTCSNREPKKEVKK